MRRGTRLALALLLVGLVVAASSSTLVAEFTSLDDHQNLVDHPHCRGFGGEQLAWMISTPNMGKDQPLTWHMYALEFEL